MAQDIPAQKPMPGSPPIYPMPERIDAPPEVIADTVLRAEPENVWRYEQKTGKTHRSESDGQG